MEKIQHQTGPMTIYHQFWDQVLFKGKIILSQFQVLVEIVIKNTNKVIQVITLAKKVKNLILISFKINNNKIDVN